MKAFVAVRRRKKHIRSAIQTLTLMYIMDDHVCESVRACVFGWLHAIELTMLTTKPSFLFGNAICNSTGDKCVGKVCVCVYLLWLRVFNVHLILFLTFSVTLVFTTQCTYYGHNPFLISHLVRIVNTWLLSLFTHHYVCASCMQKR